MRKIRDALRLRANGLTLREIYESLGLGRTTIGDHLQRAACAGLTWPLDDALSDSEMDALLFPPPSGMAAMITQPDWAAIHLERKRPHVTLMLLWEEYRVQHPGGYGYSRFCDLYRRWEGQLSPSMRQHHPTSERVLVDYAGATIYVICGETGEVRGGAVLLNSFKTGSEMRAGIGKWLSYYNSERPHSTHGILTPDEGYASEAEAMRVAA